ncbi:unnamed protein product [Didymodactylos carnosus]|uniref:Uncharacterized protein n=1 Tax=Didymodactylos carnosus TaxID=1234261 RepID=A0A814J2C1_9BILA|nr:unnamed protein product [Didymodactylos carnosus]CAF3800630.1 unnamed protein product [Didymodactylos carnosus]
MIHQHLLFVNQFIFIFNSQNTSTLESSNENLTWPDNSFMPHSIDISENFGIIAEFIQNAIDAIIKYSPIIYLINFNSSNHHPVVIDQYKPTATNDSVFLNIVSSPLSLALLDTEGNVLIFVPTPQGFYSSVSDTGSKPFITSKHSCMPIYDVSQLALETTFQVIAYPHSLSVTIPLL